MNVGALVGAAPDGPVLVVGRTPPEGRDLDLLARPADAAALVAHLRADGFVERGGRWVRFLGCEVDVVDVTDIGTWGLPEPEVDALFGEAVRLDGGRLARPSPAHVVLLEARRWTEGGAMTDGRRARIDEALRGGPGVMAEVQRRAPAWGVADALLVVSGEAPSVRVAARHARRALARRGAVVTLSGVDGSGKSSQAEALAAALDRLGYGTATVWTRITINPSLDVLAKPVKALLRLTRRRPRRTGAPPAAPAAPAPGADRPPGFGATGDEPWRAFRVRHPFVNAVWLTVVAVVNALAQARAVAPHLARGRVVVCDRYTVDSAAHLRYKYGPAERFRVQVAAIRLVSPRPLRSYLLDVPGAVAHERKPEKYTAEHLDVLGGLYREAADELGAQRLDGTAAREELFARIADDVLSALLARDAPRRRRG